MTTPRGDAPSHPIEAPATEAGRELLDISLGYMDQRTVGESILAIEAAARDEGRREANSEWNSKEGTVWHYDCGLDEALQQARDEGRREAVVDDTSWFAAADRLTAIIESRMSRDLAWLQDDGKTITRLNPEEAAYHIAHLYRTGDVVSGLRPLWEVAGLNASESPPTCPDCGLTAERIGQIHITAQRAKGDASESPPTSYDTEVIEAALDDRDASESPPTPRLDKQRLALAVQTVHDYDDDYEAVEEADEIAAAYAGDASESGQPPEAD